MTMTRGYARASSDQRAVGVMPRNRGKNYTLICALSLAGSLAPLVLDGARSSFQSKQEVERIKSRRVCWQARLWTLWFGWKNVF